MAGAFRLRAPWDDRRVRSDRPSVTARGVALTRSRMERPSTPDGDPDAEQRLYDGLGPVYGFRMGGRRGHRIEARTRFFDREVLDALTAGVPQIVLVGAGYDGRALRFRHPDVRYFEVDHPATQADKRRRVEQLGVPLDEITFVEVDLMAASVDPALAAAGLRADEPEPLRLRGAPALPHPRGGRAAPDRTARPVGAREPVGAQHPRAAAGEGGAADAA